MTKTIEQKKADRFHFLRAAYDATENTSPRFFNVWEIGDSLGLSRDESRSIFEYLSGEYLVEPKFGGGGYLLTHAGVVEVEEALSNPDEGTAHFPPYSIIVNTGIIVNQSVRGNNVSAPISVDSNNTQIDLANRKSNSKVVQILIGVAIVVISAIILSRLGLRP